MLVRRGGSAGAWQYTRDYLEKQLHQAHSFNVGSDMDSDPIAELFDRVITDGRRAAVHASGVG